MYHYWGRYRNNNILGREGYLTSLIVSGRIRNVVRHTDDVRHVGLNVCSNSHTILSHLMQPEVEVAGIVAEWSDSTMILVSIRLNSEWQTDTLPTTTYILLGGLLELASVTNALSCKLLWNVEVIVDRVGIYQHNALCLTIYNNVFNTLWSHRCLIHKYQHVRIIKALKVALGKRFCAVPNDCSYILSHLSTTTNYFKGSSHSVGATNGKSKILVSSLTRFFLPLFFYFRNSIPEFHHLVLYLITIPLQATSFIFITYIC